MNSSTSMKKEAVAKLELALDLNLSTTLLQQARMVEPFYIFSGESSASIWSDNRMQVIRGVGIVFTSFLYFLIK